MFSKLPCTSQLPKSTQRPCLWTCLAVAAFWTHPSLENWFTEVTASGKSSLPALMFLISSNTRVQLQVPLMTADSLHEMKVVFLSAERKIKSPSAKCDLTLSLRRSPWAPGSTDCFEFNINREKNRVKVNIYKHIYEYIILCIWLCMLYAFPSEVSLMNILLLHWFPFILVKEICIIFKL